MKKWIVLIVAILILIINPSKSSIFNKTYTEEKGINELNKIEVKKDEKYIKHKDNLILGKANELMILNSKGQEISKLSLNKNIEGYEISSNCYIDILDKKDKSFFSIDENGKTIFRDNLYEDIVMYKSIDKSTFISVYKKEDKQYLRIQGIDESIIKEVEYLSNITHVIDMDDDILVVDMQSDESLKSEIKIYERDGTLKENKKIEDIIINIIYEKNNIYIILENEVLILDNKLSEKFRLKLNGVEHISETNGEGVYILDKDKKLIFIENGSNKNIKSKPDIVGVELLDKKYITYSSHSIYSDGNKEIVKFDDEIKNVVCIDKETIVVCFNDYIKLLKIS